MVSPTMRVLVAEDETIIRLDLRELLERSGFEVCAEARNGEEAVALARSEQPDVAIMDVKMPKLDGIEAARRILDDRPIPIVMLTAYGQGAPRGARRAARRGRVTRGSTRGAKIDRTGERAADGEGRAVGARGVC